MKNSDVYVDPCLKNHDDKILELSLSAVTDALDDLIFECYASDGNLKAPSKKAIMSARGFLPGRCKNTYENKLNSKL